MKLLEKQVVEQHMDFLTARGWRLVRTHPVAGPGFSAGEPGAPDYLVTRYMGQPEAPWRTITWWLEVKGPRDARTCRCEVVETKRGGTRKKICGVCRQKDWHIRERGRGAIVIQSSNIETFAAWYEREFGWLHRDSTPLGGAPIASQTELF